MCLLPFSALLEWRWWGWEVCNLSLRRTQPRSPLWILGLAFVAVLGLWGMIPGNFPALAQDAPPAESVLTVDGYRQQLETTRQLVTQLQMAADADGVRQLADMAALWDTVRVITLPDGVALPVDHSYLAALLRVDPPRLAEAQGLLEALLAADVTGAPYVFESHQQSALDDVLSQPEFQWKERPPSKLEQWWTRLKQQVGAWLRGIFNTDESSGAITVTLPFGSYVMTFISAVLLILALTYVLRDLRVGLSAETALEAEDAAGEPLTSGAALQRARTFSSGGDYRTAVRYLYLSTLLLLDERGVLTYDRALTNREYARGLASVPHLARLFSSVVDVFDRVWYGEQPLDSATYEDYAEKITELSQQK